MIGPREMIQIGKKKHLPYKHEDLSSIPRTHITKPGTMVHVCNPSPGRIRGRRIPAATLPNHIDEFQAKELPYQKKKRKEMKSQNE